MYKESSPDGVERLPSGGITYRGVTFPGYNKPRASTRPEKKKMVLAKKGDQVKVIHFGQKGYKHNYSDEAKKSYLARSAGIKGKDDKFSANYWARRILWPSGQEADGSAKKTAAEKIHINKPLRSKKDLAKQLHMLQKVISKASDKEVEYAKYIAEAHANTPKEIAKLVRELNPDQPDWKIDPDMDAGFIRDVLNKKNKSRYYIRRPHLLEEDLGIPLGLKSDMARSNMSPSYPSYHSAVASYLAEHAKQDVPEESRHKLDELARRIQRTRQILGYHTIQDTDEGGRIGRDYALNQLKKKKEKTASQADYRPRGTIFLTDGKGNVFAGKTGVDSPQGFGATSPYYFPGGGIMEEGSPDTPTTKQIRDAVRKEALEELGRKVHALKVLSKNPVRLDMPEWWVAKNFRKRGIEYKGLDEYYVQAREGARDNSLYGSEGDEFAGKYYPIEQVARALEEHADAEDNAYSNANRRQAQLLRRLKTASDKKEESRGFLSGYSLAGRHGYALSQKYRPKKDDHPTQRLKERTTLDPKIIEKLRIAIKANQDKIPDGHHHVTLDDGSRAVIKELRRRHVLATILASDMDRYPGQDLQYLNTKTAGLNMGMLRSAGRLAGSYLGTAAKGALGGSLAGGALGSAYGAYQAKPGSRLQGAINYGIGGAALGAGVGAGGAMLGRSAKALGNFATSNAARSMPSKIYHATNQSMSFKRPFSAANKILSAPQKFIDKTIYNTLRPGGHTPASYNYLNKGANKFFTAPTGPGLWNGVQRTFHKPIAVWNNVLAPGFNSPLGRMAMGTMFAHSAHDQYKKGNKVMGTLLAAGAGYNLLGRGVGAAVKANAGRMSSGAVQALSKGNTARGIASGGLKGMKAVKAVPWALSTGVKLTKATGVALGGNKAYQAYRDYTQK